MDPIWSDGLSLATEDVPYASIGHIEIFKGLVIDDGSKHHRRAKGDNAERRVELLHKFLNYFLCELFRGAIDIYFGSRRVHCLLFGYGVPI